MSKTTKKEKRAPLSQNTKKGLIIAGICVVLIALLVTSILAIVKQPEDPDDNNNNNNNSGTSTLYIKNGDFAYFDKESATFPKTADNWALYSYKEPETNSDGKVTSHGFNKITDNEKVLYGVVSANEDDWATVQNDLANQNVNVTNPGIHDEEDLDKNIFMLANKEATTSSIVSAYFSISSQSSAKITVWLNTSQLKDGSKATVMIQKYASSLSAMEENRYAHNFEISKADGWQAYDFYVFNRESGSRSLVISIGLGNCYDGTNGEGVLFVDDVAFETVSANEYRKYVTSTQEDTTYAIIGEDKSDNAERYSQLETLNDTTTVTTLTLEDYLKQADAIVDGEAYSPFTKNDAFSIYKMSNDGTVKTPLALTLNKWNGNDIIVKSSDETKDHLHISFWARIFQDGRVTARGNIVLQKFEDGEWKDLDSGAFSSVVTSQNISEDNNCGWTKYDFYLKPNSNAETQIRVVYALGDIQPSYSDEKYIPKGSMYVTTPFVEEITASDYSSASSGTYAKKLNLVGNTASASITNGSFSSMSTSNANQPTGWTPVFGGANLIYKDGLGDKSPEGLPQNASDVTAVVEKNMTGNGAPAYDDSEGNFLKLTNNTATAFGYISSDFTLSAKTAYAVSVLAKTEGSTHPNIYVVKNGAENRADAIVGKIETSATDKVANDNAFGMIKSEDEGNGWTRYYIVIVTGDDSMTVRLALFNGKIDGSATQQGTVCYDIANLNTLGTYTVDTAEDSEKTNRERITFSATSGYTAFDKLTDEEISALAENSNVDVSKPDFEAIVTKAMTPAEEEPEKPEEPTPSKVNIGLLLSVISSIAMVGALLIVVVVRVFKKNSNK